MLPDITRLRKRVAQAAEEELLSRYTASERAEKSDGSVVTEADLAMQERLRDMLAREWPQYALLGEEMTPEEQRRLLAGGAAGVWCLDPLDGTSNYAAGVPFFSVSLALLVNGEPHLGLVYDPLRRECFWAQRGQGAWLDEQRLRPRAAGVNLRQSIGLIDYKRLDAALARRLAETPPYASQRSFGSVALDWCWIAAGRGHVYLHGKQKIWDYAAGWLILAEAGGRSMTLDGEQVFHADIAPRSAVAALDADLYAEWTAWLGIAG